MSDRFIYLDYAATHPVTETAKKALEESLSWFANPSSPHAPGKKAKARLEECRKGMRELLLAKKTFDLIFTSGATESNNMAIGGRDYGSEDEILCSEVSHPSLLAPSKKTQALWRPIPLEEGRVTPRSLKEALSERVKLVVLDHVNSQTGLICDVEACAQALVHEAAEKGMERPHIHVDASQSLARVPLSLKSESIDSLTLSGHKIGAPKGIGALLAKRYTLRPMIWGGGQEGGLRSGTENLSLAFAFTQCAREGVEGKGRERIRELKKDLILGLKDLGARFPFDQGQAAPHICTFIHPAQKAQTLLKRLDDEGFFLSQTSACSSRAESEGGGKTLRALGLSKEEGDHLLRVSLGFSTTGEEIQCFLQKLREISRPSP
ncbi:MAG: aminotransferase class V-fold PLP-dependent enzyme [Bacteriovoracales bacterium]|nr:aminotransferase class V-fold PLP-dependent enzyme [Bacteriovoracales bacterium]